MFQDGASRPHGRNVTPTTVGFSHNRNSDLREFERFFGCRVEFGANTNLLALTDETLRIPLLNADPKFLHTLRPFCDMAAKERKATTGTLRSAVEREVDTVAARQGDGADCRQESSAQCPHAVAAARR